jgi:deazaflavin-dependent oxidoreductase (nitroreductase family)
MRLPPVRPSSGHGRPARLERGHVHVRLDVGRHQIVRLTAARPPPRRLASVPMTPFDRLVGLPLLRLHQQAYELTGGRWGHRVGRLRTLLLRTTGRRSGRQRTVALLYHHDGDRLVVVGSKGGSDKPPSWLVNLQAQPDVEVQVGSHRFPAKARIATDGERRRLWPVMTTLWPDYERYQAQTSRRIPLVVLEPTSR